MMHFLQIAALVVCWASAAIADGGFFADSEVVFLGEYHDNPYHHARQAELVARIAPRALVFEMLTQDQAARITPDLLANPAALEAALAWADSGWPDFSMYYPIFVAAHARVYGAALPR
ncbi:ChaN family lipoprotein, partial [Puniceibacterium confluentis]|uniref:ChaN family lipoprotein n=1 Tax=Puniceibacterium confluentis TaxID=1958944 RepID=UPI0035681F13